MIWRVLKLWLWLTCIKIKLLFVGEPGRITPAHVLSFVTGCPVIPPMGYGYNIVPKILFISDRTKKLPTSSTCSIQLNLHLLYKNMLSLRKRWTMHLLTQSDLD